MKASNVVAPLLVMVLLTFLVGGTCYRMIDSWQAAVAQVHSGISETLILNNIRWNLRRVDEARVTQPEEAKARLDDVKTQALFVLRNNPGRPYTASLSHLLSLKEPQPKMENLLSADYISANLESIQGQLSDLQQSAQYTTALVTVSMIVLGLLLTGITAFDLNRLFRDLARSRDMNVTIQEEERRRIAQDLHDGAVQDLIAIKRSYSASKVDEVIETLRRICHNLKPQVLDDLGLPAAIEFLADDLRHHGIRTVQVNLEEEGLGRLPRRYELPLFRVVQELCSNIKHHAHASQVQITVVYQPAESNMLRAYVRDNGHGFDVKAARGKGMGMTGVRERIQQLGGQLTIESGPGAGTQVQFVIPVGDA